MEFIRELWLTDNAETYYVWNELLKYIDSDNHIKALSSIFFGKQFESAMQRIGKLIDECYGDDHFWESYAVKLCEHDRFVTLSICASKSDSFTISFSAIFHAACYLASQNRIDDSITPDVVERYITKLILRYDEFEKAILEIISEQNNGKTIEELKRILLPTTVQDVYLVPDDVQNDIPDIQYSDDSIPDRVLCKMIMSDDEYDIFWGGK